MGVETQKQNHTMQHGIALPGVSPMELKTNPDQKKKKKTMDDIYSNFVRNCQNLDTTKMPFSKRMDNLWDTFQSQNQMSFISANGTEVK